jgi:hypothetical protein
VGAPLCLRLCEVDRRTLHQPGACVFVAPIYPVQRGISLCIDVNSLDASFVPTDKTQAMASTLSLESAHASEYVTLSPFLLAKFQVPINLAAERNQCLHHATRTTRSIGEGAAKMRALALAMGRGQALVSREPDQQICIESGKI